MAPDTTALSDADELQARLRALEFEVTAPYEKRSSMMQAPKVLLEDCYIMHALRGPISNTYILLQCWSNTACWEINSIAPRAGMCRLLIVSERNELGQLIYNARVLSSFRR